MIVARNLSASNDILKNVFLLKGYVLTLKTTKDFSGLWSKLFAQNLPKIAHLVSFPPHALSLGYKNSRFVNGSKSALFALRKWCQRADLNCRPKAYESSALPLSYSGIVEILRFTRVFAGILTLLPGLFGVHQ